MKFVPKGPINNNPALIQILAWRRSGDKPLSEPMMVSLLTYICVTRPQWVNYSPSTITDLTWIPIWLKSFPGSNWISQNSFIWWLVAKRAICHYLNQTCLSLPRHIFVYAYTASQQDVCVYRLPTSLKRGLPFSLIVMSSTYSADKTHPRYYSPVNYRSSYLLPLLVSDPVCHHRLRCIILIQGSVQSPRR